MALPPQDPPPFVVHDGNFHLDIQEIAYIYLNSFLSPFRYGHRHHCHKQYFNSMVKGANMVQSIDTGLQLNFVEINPLDNEFNS